MFAKYNVTKQSFRIEVIEVDEYGFERDVQTRSGGGQSTLVGINFPSGMAEYSRTETPRTSIIKTWGGGIVNDVGEDFKPITIRVELSDGIGYYVHSPTNDGVVASADDLYELEHGIDKLPSGEDPTVHDYVTTKFSSPLIPQVDPESWLRDAGTGTTPDKFRSGDQVIESVMRKLLRVRTTSNELKSYLDYSKIAYRFYDFGILGGQKVWICNVDSVRVSRSKQKPKMYVMDINITLLREAGYQPKLDFGPVSLFGREDQFDLGTEILNDLYSTMDNVVGTVNNFSNFVKRMKKNIRAWTNLPANLLNKTSKIIDSINEMTTNVIGIFNMEESTLKFFNELLNLQQAAQELSLNVTKEAQELASFYDVKLARLYSRMTRQWDENAAKYNISLDKLYEKYNSRRSVTDEYRTVDEIVKAYREGLLKEKIDPTSLGRDIGLTTERFSQLFATGAISGVTPYGSSTELRLVAINPGDSGNQTYVRLSVDESDDNRMEVVWGTKDTIIETSSPSSLDIYSTEVSAFELSASLLFNKIKIVYTGNGTSCTATYGGDLLTTNVSGHTDDSYNLGINVRGLDTLDELVTAINTTDTLLKLRYIGNGTASVLVDDNSLDFTITGSTDGSSSFSIPFEPYTRISEIINKINNWEFFKMRYIGNADNCFISYSRTNNLFYSTFGSLPTDHSYLFSIDTTGKTINQVIEEIQAYPLCSIEYTGERNSIFIQLMHTGVGSVVACRLVVDSVGFRTYITIDGSSETLDMNFSFSVYSSWKDLWGGITAHSSYDNYVFVEPSQELEGNYCSILRHVNTDVPVQEDEYDAGYYIPYERSRTPGYAVVLSTNTATVTITRTKLIIRVNKQVHYSLDFSDYETIQEAVTDVNDVPEINATLITGNESLVSGSFEAVNGIDIFNQAITFYGKCPYQLKLTKSEYGEYLFSFLKEFDDTDIAGVLNVPIYGDYFIEAEAGNNNSSLCTKLEEDTYSLSSDYENLYHKKYYQASLMESTEEIGETTYDVGTYPATSIDSMRNKSFSLTETNGIGVYLSITNYLAKKVFNEYTPSDDRVVEAYSVGEGYKLSLNGLLVTLSGGKTIGGNE